MDRFWWTLVPATGLLLVAAAWLRGAEYDEQYTLFLTAGHARPAWPDTVFLAADVAGLQHGHAGWLAMARDLRAADVHPPLYFWVADAWRRLVGPELFALRLLSVACGTVSVALVGLIARRLSIPPARAILVTAGCYGFAYTGAIARGFALPEALLLAGTLCCLHQRAWIAGLLLGAACLGNYLAIFVAASLLLSTSGRRLRTVAGMLPFLLIAGWFFAAQHGARPDQFPPFRLLPSLTRLAGYQIAAVAGGLPLYVDGIARLLTGALICGVLAAALATSRPWRAPLLLPAATLATPAGLLLLGFAFDNTPIELRYLSFGLPFLALLLASQGQTIALTSLMIVQSAGLAGLMLAPQTMQPARVAAQELAEIAPDALVLLPRGNDGIGIVGAFGIEAPPGTALLLAGPADTAILQRLAGHPCVALPLLAQDRDSSAAIPVLRAALADANWRRVAIGSSLEIYKRTDAGG